MYPATRYCAVADSDIVSEQIIPERQKIQRIYDKMTSLFTVPSADEKWNPRHKYTLRGVVNEPNTVFQKLRRAPAEGAPLVEVAEVPAPEESWWKISFKTEDNTVEHTVSGTFAYGTLVGADFR